MNWIKRNATLVGILAVGILLTGVSAYYVIAASGVATEKLTNLKADADKLSRLLNAKPAPTKENAELLDTQASAVEDLAGKLERRLLESNLNITQIDGTGFQDALNKLIREVKAQAQDSGIVLASSSGDFALDFDRFTKEVPKQNLLPFLSRQLAESEFLIKALIKHHPTEIRRFEREKAPEEDPAYRPKPPEAPQKSPQTNKKSAAKEMEPEPKPIPPFESKTYQITMVSRPESIRGLLGELSASQKPFITVKSISVTNEKKDGPKRKTENPLITENPENAQSLYIVGEEKVETSLVVDVLTFRDPTPTQKPQEPAHPRAK